jgi:hypothetical protein
MVIRSNPSWAKFVFLADANTLPIIIIIIIVIDIIVSILLLLLLINYNFRANSVHANLPDIATRFRTFKMFACLVVDCCTILRIEFVGIADLRSIYI